MFAPDGTHLALGRDQVKIWDIRPLKSNRHNGFKSISSVIASSRKAIAVTDSAQHESREFRTIRLDMLTGTPSPSLGTFLASSGDRSRIATQGDAESVWISDVETGEQLARLDARLCRPVSLSLDGRVVVANGKDGTINHVDLASGTITVLGNYRGKLRDRSTGYPASPHSLALAPNGERVVTAINLEARKVDVQIWDLTRNTHRALSPPYDSEFVGACFSPSGKYLVVTPAYPEARGGLVQVWDVASNEPRRLSKFQGPDRTHRIKFSPNENLFVLTGRTPGAVVIHDILKDAFIPLSGSSGGWVINLAFSVDGRTLVTASPSGQVKFWRMPTGEELGTLNVDEQVAVVELTANDDALITGSWDAGVRILADYGNWGSSVASCVIPDKVVAEQLRPARSQKLRCPSCRKWRDRPQVVHHPDTENVWSPRGGVLRCIIIADGGGQDGMFPVIHIGGRVRQDDVRVCRLGHANHVCGAG